MQHDPLIVTYHEVAYAPEEWNALPRAGGRRWIQALRNGVVKVLEEDMKLRNHEVLVIPAVRDDGILIDEPRQIEAHISQILLLQHGSQLKKFAACAFEVLRIDRRPAPIQ